MNETQNHHLHRTHIIIISLILSISFVLHAIPTWLLLKLENAVHSIRIQNIRFVSFNCCWFLDSVSTKGLLSHIFRLTPTHPLFSFTISHAIAHIYKDHRLRYYSNFVLVRSVCMRASEMHLLHFACCWRYMSQKIISKNGRDKRCADTINAPIIIRYTICRFSSSSSLSGAIGVSILSTQIIDYRIEIPCFH